MLCGWMTRVVYHLHTYLAVLFFYFTMLILANASLSSTYLPTYVNHTSTKLASRSFVGSFRQEHGGHASTSAL